jgi:formamidopyrimidine-DNA glycosylase
MPELPEVEVVRCDLDRVIRGRTITRVEVSRDRAVRREPDATAFAAALTDRTVTGTSRVGKFVVVHLDGPDTGDGHRDGAEVVILHLGMSGQLRVADDAHAAREKHTHVVFGLDDDRELRFVDPRTFGQVYRNRIPSGHGAGSASRPLALAHLGPDALDEVRGPDDLAPRFAGRRVAVKTRLMDQQAIAGLGNIYSDEILFRAGVLGSRASGSLAEAEIARIQDACATVLRDAIAARGSSLADAQYVDLSGRAGEYQHAHTVHARHGLPCLQCGATVQRARAGGRYGYWCPVCQT